MTGEETALWFWLLFESGLPRAQAKRLLAALPPERPLRAWLETVRRSPQRWGLTPAEGARLHPPDRLAPTAALRWNEATYPPGLRPLPPERRPALLFFRGNLQLLVPSFLLLGEAPPADEGLMEEAIATLLGDRPLAAIWGSKAAEVLLQEMASASGQAILFIRQGLSAFSPPPALHAFVGTGRLLLVSFLPPSSQGDPRWAPVLAKVEAAAAGRMLHCGVESPPAALSAVARIFWLTTSSSPAELSPAVERIDSALLLLDETPEKNVSPSPAVAPPVEEASLSPQEMLTRLTAGGKVPERLRRRILGE